MGPTVLHLRSETKPLEHRSALTPYTTKALVDAGYVVNVERSPVRIFNDDEFVTAGASLVPEFSWVDSPKEHLIVGLKELPEEDFPLQHSHVSFCHCYKQQSGWEKVLSRFPKGGGTLYDLEFLTDESGRRIAAFGYHAGYAGAAIALLNWSHQVLHPETSLPGVSSYPTDRELVADVKRALESALPKSKAPTVLVMGALGRCGRGAVDLCRAVGLPEDNILKWDMEETKNGGPFREIAESDVFVNCIYLMKKIPPFITKESLSSPGRKLSVICDVSCDPNSENNPIPVYSDYSTFDKPTLPVEGISGDGPRLSVISIDHLPSLLPREASEAFSRALLPSLLQLERRHNERVWTEAEDLFKKKVGELPADYR